MIDRDDERRAGGQTAASEVEPWPDGRSFFRGCLVALPLSGLLWWAIIEVTRTII